LEFAWHYVIFSTDFSVLRWCTNGKKLLIASLFEVFTFGWLLDSASMLKHTWNCFMFCRCKLRENLQNREKMRHFRVISTEKKSATCLWQKQPPTELVLFLFFRLLDPVILLSGPIVVFACINSKFQCSYSACSSFR
jgi:hypothetical protein